MSEKRENREQRVILSVSGAIMVGDWGKVTECALHVEEGKKKKRHSEDDERLSTSGRWQC